MFLIETVLLSLISLFNTLFLNILNRENEGVSFLWVYYGHNHLSAVLVLAIPIAIFFLKKNWHLKKRKILFIGICSLLIFTLLFTFARASMVALVLAAGLGSWKFTLFPNRKILLAVGSLISIVWLLAVGFYSLNFHQDKSFDGMPARLKEMSYGIQNFIKNPITGTGLGTYHLARDQNRKFSSDFTQNFIIDSLSDTGIISTLTLLGFLITALFLPIKAILSNSRDSEDMLKMALWIGLVGLLINNFVDFDLQLPSIGLLFWIFLGLLHSSMQTDVNKLEKN